MSTGVGLSSPVEKIFGLVSLSDLQRLPVRAALFGMVTHLESEMMKAIQREFSYSDDGSAAASPRPRARACSRDRGSRPLSDPTFASWATDQNQ